jgi:toxin-antitoxin system PIN domain toxin
VIVCDVNVLVYAFRTDAPDHERYASWLNAQLDTPSAYGVSSTVLAGFVRVTTHPRVFTEPTPTDVALDFCRALMGHPNAVALIPGERHWSIFDSLCREAGARGNLVPDAFLAALAVEHGAELVTTDRDFARFSALRWRHPLR